MSAIHVAIAVAALGKMLALPRILVDEARMKFGVGGLRINVVDPSHVAMGATVASSELFEEYAVDEDREVGWDLDKLFDILKVLEKAEYEGPIDIVIDDTHTILGVESLGWTRTMKNVDTEVISDPKIPKLDPINTAVIPHARFALALKTAASISDHVLLTSDKAEVMTIEAEGSTDRMRVVVKEAEMGAGTVLADYARSLFPEDYLSKAIAPFEGAPNLGLGMGTDIPVDIRAEFFGGKLNHRYLLAPRIESE